MGSKNENQKPFNSYRLLQMKMNEVQKSKKKEIPSSTSSSNSPCYSTRKSSFPPESAESTSDMMAEKSSSKEKEFHQNKKKENVDYSIPDRTYGDFYCIICDSHMNSDEIWTAHVIGKRHQKNIKKGDPDTKYNDLDVKSSIEEEIKNVKDAVVGLSFINEIRRKEVGVPPLYKCFICQATFPTVTTVIEHVLSMKHRLNYIKEKSPSDYELLNATNLKKGQMEPLVAEVASKLEGKFGSGTVAVKQERQKSTKRGYDSDDDEDDYDIPRKAKYQKYDEKNPSVWKSFGSKRNDFNKDCREIIEERRHARVYNLEDDSDFHPIKQPVFNHLSRNYRSSSPPESSKIGSKYSTIRNPSPPEDDYIPDSHYSRYCVSPKESLNKDFSSSRSLSRRTLEEHPHSMSYQIQNKEPVSSHNYTSPTETNNQETVSNLSILKDFVQKVYALPTEIFMKIVLLKLDNIDIKGIDELTLLSKVINKAQTVFCNKLPSDVEAIVRQKMFRNTENHSVTPPATSEVAESSTQSRSAQGSDLSFIRDILNGAMRSEPSPSISQNTAPHQSSHPIPTIPYQNNLYGNVGSSYQTGSISSPNSNYSHNSVSPSMVSGIPGLAVAEDDTQAEYKTYQPHYDFSSRYPHYTF